MPAVQFVGQITPGPPASVMSRPGCLSTHHAWRTAAAAASTGRTVGHPMIPALSNRAARRLHGRAMAPVWLAAALAPASVTPDLMPTMAQPFASQAAGIPQQQVRHAHVFHLQQNDARSVRP
jgi:hypothetical protein